MTDVFTAAKRSQIMAAVRSRRNRSTELVLAVAFCAAGMKGWRRHLPLPGKPDFAFPKQKVIVFVDGCFWHGCPLCGEIPRSNRTYWASKIENNKRRDRLSSRMLRSRGWTVCRIWEHSLRQERDVRKIIRRIQKLLT